MFEELFEMDTGYVLDFSNAEFERFIMGSINIDIYNGPGYQEYCSKANKLRQIWDKEPDSVVGTLMNDLLVYYENLSGKKEGQLPERIIKLIAKIQKVVDRLQSTSTSINLPLKSEETLQTLIEDINDSLARNKPTLVLDRLHTFSTKLLRDACVDNGLNIKDDRGKYLPLHSLAGMLRKKYEKERIFESTFTLRALQNSISLFESYNEVRNVKSYAHVNDILDTVEADFVVKIMLNVITFIDKIENYRKKQDKQKIKDFELDLPF